MKVVYPQFLEPVGTAGRLKQLTAQLAVVVHGAAGVDKQQDLDGVAPGLLVADLEDTALFAGMVDGLINVELVLCAVLGGEGCRPFDRCRVWCGLRQIPPPGRPGQSNDTTGGKPSGIAGYPAYCHLENLGTSAHQPRAERHGRG